MNKCKFCDLVPKGQPVYRVIDGTEYRVHKDCYKQFVNKRQNWNEMKRYKVDWRNECINYLADLYDDEVDEFTLERLDGLGESKFNALSQKRFKYLDANGYTYKQIFELLEKCWERRSICWTDDDLEYRANTVFKKIIDYLKNEEVNTNYFKAKDFKKYN